MQENRFVNPSTVKARILIAVEDPNLLDILKSLFRSLEHRVKAQTDNRLLAETLKSDLPDILVCDWAAWEALSLEADETRPELPPVILTASYGELEPARQALGHGVTAILSKPVRTQAAIDAVTAILPTLAAERKRRKHEAEAAGDTDEQDTKHFGLLIGEHSRMQALYETISKIAVTDMTVLIRGESGTGKDLVARAIHGASPRKDRPFIAVNCSAMPENLLESELFGHVKGAFTGALKSKEGLFKAADGGTIFLDEIGSVSMGMQLSLLRILQDRTIRPVGSTQSFQVDVRVIAATNENLEDRIRNGLFREDLFFRLNSFPLSVPPLREHPSDVPALARQFLSDIRSEDRRPMYFTDDAIDAMMRYPWPGNIRELQNLVRRCAAVAPSEGGPITASELALTVPEVSAEFPSAADTSSEPKSFMTLKAYLKSCERDYMNRVYEACGRDKEAAARILGISIGTFYRKLDE